MAREDSSESNLGRLTLVVGVDGSGKSAFLKCMSELENTVIFEPTATTEAKEFKQRYINELVDEDYINKHDNLFLKLNEKFDKKTSEKLNEGVNVAIYGSVLITFVAHSLMRNIINKKGESIDENVDRWIKSEEFIKPDEIVYLHAPNEVIIDRIKKRQQKGHDEEKFWGFNSPHFLDFYQETWHTIIDKFSKEAIVNCIKIDTSIYSREDTFDLYIKKRKNIHR